MLIADDKEIDIFVGSRIGSFKHIKYHTDSSKNNKKCIENLVDIKCLQRDEAVTCLEWGNAEQTEILLGRRNQQIQLYDTQQGFTKSYSADFGTGHVVGLGRCKRKLLAAVSSGVVKIWSKKEEATVDTGGKLDRMRVCADDTTVFGTGGEENELKVWRVGEPAGAGAGAGAAFVAKNVPADWLQLRRPVGVADLAFARAAGGRVAATCSRHGYVRLYDTRAQRRPVCNVEFPNMAATCLAPADDDRQVFVGFARGQLHLVDFRKARPDKGYRGCAGAVSGVALARGGLLVSAGLDRQLRVHHTTTKELLYKQYLTSKLSCLLVQNENCTPLRAAPAPAGTGTAGTGTNAGTGLPHEHVEETETREGDDMEQLFRDMDTVGEKPKKKKLLIEPAPAKKSKPSVAGSTTSAGAGTGTGTTASVGAARQGGPTGVEGGREDEPPEAEDPIAKLLRSTEKHKRRLEKRKKLKKAKSVFHNA